MSKNKPTYLGKVLLEKAEQLDISLKELCVMLDVPRSTLHRLIYDEMDLPLSRINQLAKSLNCEPAYLLGATDDAKYQKISVKQDIIRVVKLLDSVPLEQYKQIEKVLIGVIEIGKKISSNTSSTTTDKSSSQE